MENRSTQICKFAQLLRQNGDKVLNQDFSLTLSAQLLRVFNESFASMFDRREKGSPTSFVVTESCNSKSEVLRDLQLVFDFIQKTVRLTLLDFNANETASEDTVDVSIFSNLKQLEIRKLNVKQIMGIQQLRAQIKKLICFRCLHNIEDLITTCGGDYTSGFLWNDLLEIDFSYNFLKDVDNSFEFAISLQYLNLSHNYITSAESIKWLPNLNCLNLSYNRLSRIPSFHADASKKLRIIILNNNLLDEVNGLSRLEVLMDLDLADNCLVSRLDLIGLCALSNLKILKIVNNPVACQKSYRESIIRILHRNIAYVSFLLDDKLLSTDEKNRVGEVYERPIFKHTSNDEIFAGIRRTDSQQSVSLLSSSTNSKQKNNDSGRGSITKRGSDKQKKIKARTVEIVDSQSVDDKNQKTASAPKIQIPEDFENKAKTAAHLETKKQIEMTRSQFGEEWLQISNVNNVLQSFENPISSNSSRRKLLFDAFNFNGEKSEPGGLTSFAKDPVNSIEAEKEHANTDTLEENKFEVSDIFHDADVLQTTCSEEPEDVVSDPEENEMTYIVRIEDQQDELFLAVSNYSIKEKDIITGRTKIKWSLKSLLSCDLIKSETLRINFASMRKDKKQRIYHIQEKLCQQLQQRLRHILSQRTLSELNQTLYRCISCATQFSREKVSTKQQSAIICPECFNQFVVEVQETIENELKTNTGSVELPIETAEIVMASEINSSSGKESTGSPNDSSITKTTHSSDNSLSNRSFQGDSSIHEGSAEKTIDSDVEIISNPSQSSIEVIDTGYHHSTNRLESSTHTNTSMSSNQSQQSVILRQAFSSHEHQAATSCNPLTESSSSGSVADSVCTAYEQDNKIAAFETPIIENRVKSSKAGPLDGIIQSTNLLLSRRDKNIADTTLSNFEFNWPEKDFKAIDHRIKVFLYQKAFNEVNEHLDWFIKGDIINCEENLTFQGALCMSNLKLYVFEAIGKENEIVEKWIKPVNCCSRDSCCEIAIFPLNVGFNITVNYGLTYAVFPSFSGVVNNFFGCISNETEHQYKILDPAETLVKITNKLENTTKSSLKMMAFVEHCRIISQTNSDLSPALLFTTDEILILSKSFEFLKLSASIVPLNSQLVTNLIEIERPRKDFLRLIFLNENNNESEIWECKLRAVDITEKLYHLIRDSWENVFGVSLDKH